MKTTFRLMGVADWITLGNGLLGTFSIASSILAFNSFSSTHSSHVSEKYIWLAMLFIILSVLGDLIDGPIARRYSKQRHLGGYLDLMSDSISFGVAPAILVFGMFSRSEISSPFWTILLAVSCCWLVICTMLRLARFQHESNLENRWFHGLASPGSAIFILALSGLVWLQPELIPIEFANSINGDGNNSPLGWLVLLGVILAGMLMISDRRLPKLSNGMNLNLSLVVLLSMIFATTIQISGVLSRNGKWVSFMLLSISLLLVIVYVLMGPKMCDSMLGKNNSGA